METAWQVVIPSAGAENLVRSVKSVLETHPDARPDQIVVIDDGARVGAEAQLPSGIVWIEGEKPFVFARNINRGISQTHARHVVIMGDDIEVLTPDGFGIMARVLDEIKEIGILSPGIEGRVSTVSQRYDPTFPIRIERNEWLCAPCLMLSTKVWKEIGGLDEKFVGYGYDDADYSIRAVRAGYLQGTLNLCKVYHERIRSVWRHKPDYQKSFEQNEKLFMEKWGTMNFSEAVAS